MASSLADDPDGFGQSGGGTVHQVIAAEQEGEGTGAETLAHGAQGVGQAAVAAAEDDAQAAPAVVQL